MFLEHLSVPARIRPVHILFHNCIAFHPGLRMLPECQPAVWASPVSLLRGAHPGLGVTDLDVCWRWRRAALIFGSPGRFFPASPPRGRPEHHGHTGRREQRTGEGCSLSGYRPCVAAVHLAIWPSVYRTRINVCCLYWVTPVSGLLDYPRLAGPLILLSCFFLLLFVF